MGEGREFSGRIIEFFFVVIRSRAEKLTTGSTAVSEKLNSILVRKAP